MGRALAKRHLRVIGIDDGPFRRTDARAPLVLVAIDLPGVVEGIELGHVAVDGTDATDRILELLLASPHLPGARAILVDGATVGGFNPVDIAALADATGRAVVSVTPKRPDLAAIERAVRTYFPRDAARRLAVLTGRPTFAVPLSGGSVHAAVAGATRREARSLLARTTLVGRWPEPLRLARLLARALPELGGGSGRRATRPSSSRSGASSSPSPSRTGRPTRRRRTPRPAPGA